jgi:type IV pilus assembly protein PilY1
VEFTTASSGALSATQKTALGGTDATKQTEMVNYLRGYRGKEESYASGYLRVRDRILGDIVNSTPLFIGSPNANTHAGAGYAGGGSWAAFVTAQTARTPVVYVGANDGMLHAFNATNGREVFAFVPNTVIVNGLKDYADPAYEHKFYVDGDSAAADIYDTSTSSWKTVLVGSLGRGGPGIFALDVTDPASPSLLWELNGSDIPQLGKNIGRPTIAQTADGVWKVIFGNGPDSSAGRAQLIMIGIGGGSANNGVVTTHSPTSTTTNGLTALLVRDSEDGDTFADIAYGGDLHGNMWKFSNLGGTITSTNLFSAVDPSSNEQPITGAPMVGRDPNTAQLWVFFGTGRYLTETDITDHQVQTWYGIKDTNTTISGRSALVERRITAEPTVAGLKARVIEAGNAAQMISKDGWYIDLVSPASPPSAGQVGERMVVQNRFQGVALVGTTRIPGYTDPCTPGGTGFIMAISPFTGARLASTFFDLNGNGLSDDGDKAANVDTNGDGLIDSSDDPTVPVSGFALDSMPNNPIFIEDVLQVGLDDGTTEVMKVFGSAVDAARTSWRELFRQ